MYSVLNGGTFIKILQSPWPMALHYITVDTVISKNQALFKHHVYKTLWIIKDNKLNETHENLIPTILTIIPYSTNFYNTLKHKAYLISYNWPAFFAVNAVQWVKIWQIDCFWAFGESLVIYSPSQLFFKMSWYACIHICHIKRTVLLLKYSCF